MLGAMTAISCQSPAARGAAEPPDPALAASAINALGLELLTRGSAPGQNALLSPYSLQAALAMTYAGADGETLAEMARVLHYPDDEAALHRSFADLRARLEAMTRASEERLQRSKERGGPADPVILTTANRLFGEKSYQFRTPFLELTASSHGAPFQPVDFITGWMAARNEINSWVEEQTRQRIRDLIPPDGLNKYTRLVLVNALYLKAPWATEFPERATGPAAFHLADGTSIQVPTMTLSERLGHWQGDGFKVVTKPFSGGDLQLLILLPDAADGLKKLESGLTAEKLVEYGRATPTLVNLHLPKFKLEPPLLRVGDTLKALGLRTAFNQPEGSANFDRMAPRKPDDYLFISEVFHKTFLALDEHGTEAAAATAVVMMRPTSVVLDPPQPVEVKVDRPFLFAIQQTSTGACLFLGRVVDPR